MEKNIILSNNFGKVFKVEMEALINETIYTPWWRSNLENVDQFPDQRIFRRGRKGGSDSGKTLQTKLEKNIFCISFINFFPFLSFLNKKNIFARLVGREGARENHQD